MEWVQAFFALVLFVNVVYDTISLFQLQQKEDGSKEDKEYPKSTLVEKIITLLSILVVLSFALFIIFDTTIPRIIPILLFTIPVTLSQISEAIKASKPLKRIIEGEKDDQDLSFKDRAVIDVVAIAILYTFSIISQGRVISYVTSLALPNIIRETLLSIYTLSVFFLFSFVLIVQLIIPFRCLGKLCEIIAKMTARRITRISKHLYSVFENPHMTSFYTDRLIEIVVISKGIKKIKWLSLLTVSFLLDLMMGIAYFIYAFVLCGCLSAIFEFFQLTGKLLLHTIRFIVLIPGRKVVKNAFRLSVIFSVAFLVISNRLSLLFSTDDNFNGIVEFVASAIIIPIIFEWIYSSKNEEKQKPEIDDTLL